MVGQTVLGTRRWVWDALAGSREGVIVRSGGGEAEMGGFGARWPVTWHVEGCRWEVRWGPGNAGRRGLPGAGVGL